jgi:predicted dienelactone hydrolase
MIAPLILAAAIATDSWQPASLGYREPQAQSAVATIGDVTLRNATRGRSLPLEIYYPAGLSEKVPVIIFSHGAGGTKDTYERVLSYWASFGYVVIAPSHPDGIAPYQPGAPVGQWLRATIGGVIKNPNEWTERPRDVSFIIDSLPQIEQYEPALKGHLDTTHIGVGGHSYGAQTAMLIAGATIRVPGSAAAQVSEGDPRVRAIVAMSPQGTSTMGFTSNSWRTVDRPVMILTGSRDIMQTGQTPLTRREPFDGEPTGDKYYVFIDGANHFTFTGARLLPNEDPMLTEIDIATLAYWDAYLKRDTGALAYLRSGALADMGRPAVTLDRK